MAISNKKGLKKLRQNGVAIAHELGFRCARLLFAKLLQKCIIAVHTDQKRWQCSEYKRKTCIPYIVLLSWFCAHYISLEPKKRHHAPSITMHAYINAVAKGCQRVVDKVPLAQSVAHVVGLSRTFRSRQVHQTHLHRMYTDNSVVAHIDWRGQPVWLGPGIWSLWASPLSSLEPTTRIVGNEAENKQLAD